MPDPEPAPTDAQLLSRHLRGDSRAFADLVGRHQNRLWAVALRTTSDPHEAADALQDALLSAHRGAGSFRAQSQVSTWLHRIVVNACLDRLRVRAARPTVPLIDDDDPPEVRDRVAEGETRMVVHQALMGIPTDQRAAVVLVDVEGWSVADVAKRLGVAEGTVKSRCARGRAKLAVTLGHLRETSGNQNAGRAVQPTMDTDTSGEQP